MRPLDVLGAAKSAVDEIAFRKLTIARSPVLRHRPHQTAIRAVVPNLDRGDDRLARRAQHLHVIGGAEAGIGHLHHPRLRVRGGGAWLFRLLAVAALVIKVLALTLDLGKRRLCGLHARAALARRPLLGSPDALIAGRGIGIRLVLELFHHRLRQCQLPVERRLAPERASAGICPYPHSVLRQRLEIDKAGLGQRRKMLAEQPVEQIGATHPKVRQRMIVHRYAATEPAIDVIRGALPRQGPGAADPIAGGVKPKRQHKPRRGRRMTRPVLARLDPIFQLSQIEVFHVIPDHPRAVVRADQAVDIDTPKLDLVACGFAQPRRPERGRIALRLRLLRQLAKQFVAAHPRLPRINSCSESQLASLALPCRHDARKIHSLVGWVRREAP